MLTPSRPSPLRTMHQSARLGRTLLSAGGSSCYGRLGLTVHSVRRSVSTLSSDGLGSRRPVRVTPLASRLRPLWSDIRPRSEHLSTDGVKTAKDSAAATTAAKSESQQPQTAAESLQAEADALKTVPAPQQQPPAREPQSVSEFDEENKKALPYLSAPLGMTDQPSSKKLTWAERREQQFDHDRRMRKRRALVKEATRGYFHDVHAMRAHRGKTWLAPTTLIRQDRSLYFPAIEGKSLADKHAINTADMLPGKVSLVCILTSQISEEHLKSFYTSTYEIYKNDPNFQMVQINLQENYIKAALVSIFMSSLRRQIDESLHKTYMLSHQDLTVEREAIALHNKHVGYIYLVGPDAKIRWAGCGFAERHESQALVACTGVLLSRLTETQAGKPGSVATTTMARTP